MIYRHGRSTDGKTTWVSSKQLHTMQCRMPDVTVVSLPRRFCQVADLSFQIAIKILVRSQTEQHYGIRYYLIGKQEIPLIEVEFVHKYA